MKHFFHREAESYVRTHKLSIVPIEPGTKHPPKGFPLKRCMQEPLSLERTIEIWMRDPDLHIGLICGAAAGHLEVLDFDEESAYFTWREFLGEVNGHELLQNLVIEKSPRGGRHVYYRCPEGIEPNQKLARRWSTQEELALNPQQLTKTTIETRGEGGLIVCFPTPGYELEQGNLTIIPTISAEVRQIMFYAARRQDKVLADDRTVGSSTDRNVEAGHRFTKKREATNSSQAGQDFNQRADWREILGAHGWRFAGSCGNQLQFRRPGKMDLGISATVNPDYGLLWVFTTNGFPLEADHSYSKFGALAVLEFGGDYAACAKDLGRRGYGAQNARHEIPQEPPCSPSRIDVLEVAKDLAGRIGACKPETRGSLNTRTSAIGGSTAIVEARKARITRVAGLSDSDRGRYSRLRHLLDITDADPVLLRHTRELLDLWMRCRQNDIAFRSEAELKSCLFRIIGRPEIGSCPERELTGHELAIVAREIFTTPAGALSSTC